MRRFLGAIAILGLIAVGSVLAQDGPITIKMKKASVGDQIKETKSEVMTQKITITVMGQKQVKDEKTTSSVTFTEEVIEKPKGAAKPSKAKRTYHEAEMTASGEKQDLGLKGKIVLIEKKGDKFEFTIDGKELNAKASDMLNKEFTGKKSSAEDDFLPKEPVKVGESWKIDVAKATEELQENMVVDVKKSTATGKLTKAYEKNGKKYGVMDIKMELVITKLKGDQEIPLKEGSKLTMEISMDGCIDGSEANGKGKMSMKGVLSGDIMGQVQLVIDVDAQMTGNTVELPKK